MKTFIIAEVGVNHDGEIEKAKRLISGAKYAGADAVKFQTFRAEQLARASAPKAKYQEISTGPGSQYEMLKSLELSFSEFEELKQYADELQIEFMSTPFDIDSLHFLINKIKVDRIKLSSGDLTNLPMIYEVGKFKVKTIISTGGAKLDEIDNAIIAWAMGRIGRTPVGEDFRRSEASRLKLIEGLDLSDLSVLQCTTQYPASLENLNLRVITNYLRRFPCAIGYSDHSTGVEAALGAVALGAQVIEKHITENKKDSGPDHSASMEVGSFKLFVESIRSLEVALGSESKFPSAEESQTISIARKSLVAARNIDAGHVISDADLITLRPLGGLDPCDYWTVLGTRAATNIAKGEFIEKSSLSEYH